MSIHVFSLWEISIDILYHIIAIGAMDASEIDFVTCTKVGSPNAASG